jgi:hypothetical protein
MAFDVGFRYENVPCTLALQKFGIRVYVATKVPEGKVRQFSDRLLGKLTKGVELVEKQVLRPLADQQLAEGNVTIANQRGFLRTTYEHFRDEALLVGRAAHAEPAAGQSLRRYAPPGLPAAPSQLPVNAGPGSGAETGSSPQLRLNLARGDPCAVATRRA